MNHLHDVPPISLDDAIAEQAPLVCAECGEDDDTVTIQHCSICNEADEHLLCRRCNDYRNPCRRTQEDEQC